MASDIEIVSLPNTDVQLNSIYDPLGLAGPVTVKAKILMRQLWISDLTLDWDDPIPSDHTKD